MSSVLAGLITALLSVITRVATASLAEEFMRRVLIHSLEWIVASTGNSVDDDLAQPIIDALRGSSEAKIE